MKNILNISAVMLSSLLFVSCEDVITLDLDTASEKYVIEASISDQTGSGKVLLSKTKSFNSSNDFIGQSGAVVTIEDDLGNSSRLTETSTGVYTNPTLKGSSGVTYKLKVEINGNVFTSSSTLPAQVKLDSVYLKDIQAFDGLRLFAHVRFTDPIGKGNYYRFIVYRNGVYDKRISVTDDDLIDGNLVNQLLAPREFDDESKLLPGDVVKVDFLTIDRNVYRYWFSVESGAQGDGETAAPINPVSNISGGAIGYFSAQTIQSQEVTVKNP